VRKAMDARLITRARLPDYIYARICYICISKYLKKGLLGKETNKNFKPLGTTRYCGWQSSKVSRSSTENCRSCVHKKLLYMHKQIFEKGA